MQKNLAGQRWVVFAFGGAGHASEGQPITGDAANITANLRIDGAAANATDDVNPTELEDGYYVFDITAVESNGDNILLSPQSSTANVEVIAVPGALWTIIREGVKKNAAFTYTFPMVDETDGFTLEISLTVSGERSIDGGAFEAVTGTIAELSDGYYVFSGVAADTNGDMIAWRFFATGAADAGFTFVTVE